MLVVVRVVDDDPHSRGCAVTGDAFPERERDASVPVEKEEFLSCRPKGCCSADGHEFRGKKRHQSAEGLTDEGAHTYLSRRTCVVAHRFHHRTCMHRVSAACTPGHLSRCSTNAQVAPQHRQTGVCVFRQFLTTKL